MAVASILAAGKRHRPTCFDDDDDEPQFVGELSWQERDAAARARAVELTDSPVESRQHSRIPGAAHAANASAAATLAAAASAAAASAAAASATAATASAAAASAAAASAS